MRFFQATIDDLPRILPCAREFCAVLKVELNEAHYISDWERILSSNRGVIFLLEDDTGEIAGGIGGVKCVDQLDASLMAIEKFWYVKEKFRGGFWSVRLVKIFEKWAFEENNCDHVVMVHMEASMPSELKHFYAHSDYVLLETAHRKTRKVAVVA